MEDPFGVSLALLTPSCPPTNVFNSFSSSKPPIFPVSFLLLKVMQYFLYLFTTKREQILWKNRSHSFCSLTSHPSITTEMPSLVSFHSSSWAMTRQHYWPLFLCWTPHSSLVSPPYLLPFILFLSLSFSLRLKQLVQLLSYIRVTWWVLDSSLERVIQVRHGLRDQFGLVSFDFLHFLL